MNLDNIINEALVQRTRTKKVRKPPTKEQKERTRARYCVKLLKTGDYDHKKKSHVMSYYAAVRLGYVEKGTFKILID